MTFILGKYIFFSDCVLLIAAANADNIIIGFKHEDTSNNIEFMGAPHVASDVECIRRTHSLRYFDFYL